MTTARALTADHYKAIEAAVTAAREPSKQSVPLLLSTGTIVKSSGQSFSYQILGAICRLYDREELPYSGCRLQWRGKEPSWNHVGKRFVIDMSTRHKASYQVYLLSETGSGCHRKIDRAIGKITANAVLAIRLNDFAEALVEPLPRRLATQLVYCSTHFNL